MGAHTHVDALPARMWRTVQPAACQHRGTCRHTFACMHACTHAPARAYANGKWHIASTVPPSTRPQEINFDDRETLKKYVGVRDHLSREPGTRSKLVKTLHEVLDAAKALPADSDYRRALEATCQYRLTVCEANEKETAIEDVLDSHVEEVIQECFDEIKLIPYMAGACAGVGLWRGGSGKPRGGGFGCRRASARARALACMHARTHARTHTARCMPRRCSLHLCAGPAHACGSLHGMPSWHEGCV